MLVYYVPKDIDMQNETEYSGISISVKELAAMIASGEGGSSFAYRAELGRNVHSQRQAELKRKHPDFNGEYQISFRFKFGKLEITVKGRPDAVYDENGITVVEEIKTLLNRKDAFDSHSPETLDYFRTQLDIYCYLMKLLGKEPLKARMYLVNLSESGGERILDYEPDFGTIALRLERAFSRIISHSQRREHHHLNLKHFTTVMRFPFPKLRPYQKQMMDEAAAAVQTGGRLMLSAPTGIGKTAGVLFPAIKEAFNMDKRIYFATSKTTQRLIVADFIQRMKLKDAPFSALFLNARAKMCPENKEVCEWEQCPYMADFNDKMTRSGLIDELYNGAVFDGESIYNRVTPLKMCPFAVSLQMAEQADLIVGDYNYVFDPRIFLRRIFANGAASDFVLIVDEAHNLPDRVRNYYSPEIVAEEVELMLANIKGKSYRNEFHRNVASLLRSIINQLHKHNTEEGAVELNLEEWGELYDQTEKALMEYFLTQAEFGGVDGSDPLLKFLRDLSWFCKTAQLGDGIGCLNLPQERRLKIVCLDPGIRIKDTMASFHSVIAMSATLEPAEFFSRMLGLYENANAVNLPYPFPCQNRTIRIEAGISTLFKFRSRFKEKVAEVIDNTYERTPGGYFVFFPSYAYMQEVAQHINSPHIMQEAEMTEQSRMEYLNQVAEGDKIFLAVMGGIFSEGVDYPGMLSGVIIVGPGLPLYCIETELIRDYFQRIYNRGFEYAYIFPGMNRVIQAAGRLIRSEYDQGSITLIGARFVQEPYRSLIPRDWYIESVEELVDNKL